MFVLFVGCADPAVVPPAPRFPLSDTVQVRPWKPLTTDTTKRGGGQ